MIRTLIIFLKQFFLNNFFLLAGGEFQYKGCVYSTIRGCNLELKDMYTQGKLERSCDQCSGKNYCNPAGHATLSVGLTIVTVTLAVLGKYL